MLSHINEDLALPLLAQRPTIKPSDHPHPSVQGRRVIGRALPHILDDKGRGRG